MQRAFIVKLDVADSADTDGIADDIRETLQESYSVIDVKAWQASTLNNLAPEHAELKGERVAQHNDAPRL